MITSHDARSFDDSIVNPPFEGTGSPAMSHSRNLPVKKCRRCGRPFTWRKKWERDWPRVAYCSDRCRQDEPRARRGEAR